MALLTSLLRDVELDYVGRGDGTPAGPVGPIRQATLVVVVTLVGLVLAVGLVQRRTDEPSQIARRAALMTQIESRTDAVTQLQADITSTRARISTAEQELLARTTTGAALSAQIVELERAAALTAVTGPGLQIVVDDAPIDASTKELPAGGRVLDRDLQLVVNGLWQNGAEAVALNGYRLTATSAIRAAGDAILVDFRPLVPPYTLQAIADPGPLQKGFEQSAAGADLRSLNDQYGIRWQLDAVDRLALAAGATGPR